MLMLKILSSITMIAYAYAFCFLVRFAMQWIDPAGKSPASRVIGVMTNPVIALVGSRAVVNGTNFAPLVGFFIINMCVYLLNMIVMFFPS